MTDPLLTRRRMFQALGRVGDLLGRAGVVADIHLVGGAVMVMEYDARDATAEPHGAVERAVSAVAQEMDLPRSWLNQQASSFVPQAAEGRRSRSFDHPHLHVYAIAPSQLLAMKVRAGRPTDAEDIAVLCRLLNISSADEVAALTVRAFPGEEVPARGLGLVRDVLARPHPPKADT